MLGQRSVQTRAPVILHWNRQPQEPKTRRTLRCNMFGLMPVAFPLLLLFCTSSPLQKKKNNDLRVVPVATAPSLDGREPQQDQNVSWENAQIDYSAGNEYIAAHYGDSSDGGGDDSSYFADNVKMERIYDARKTTNTTFATHGFTLLRYGDSQEFQTMLESVDWRNLSSIQTLYLPQVEDAIRNVVFRDTPVAHVMFWCPTLRTGAATDSSSTGTTSTTPQGGYAATAHIDTDVNAYASVRDLVRMIIKNQLVVLSPEPQAEACRSDANNNNDLGSLEDMMVTAIETHRCRFAIVNAWKNIGITPVTNAPLAFMPARYSDINTAFPYGTLDESSCRWYTFPSMTANELLLFAQYDRDASQTSDVWHCALSLPSSSSSSSPSSCSRQSFDIRCFVLFADSVVVPAQRDRLHHRRPSRLDRSGSAAFCADQSRRRRHRRLEEENE
jgi:hypothetical protein